MSHSAQNTTNCSSVGITIIPYGVKGRIQLLLSARPYGFGYAELFPGIHAGKKPPGKPNP